MDNVTLAFVLLALGLGMMVIEMLIPTGGLFYVVGGGMMVIGVTLAVYYGDAYLGIGTLIGTLILVPLVTGGMVYFFPNTAMGDRLPAPTDVTTFASMAGVQSLDQYRGRVGKTASTLRPAGIVDFEGKRIDCVTEGMMIDAHQWVRCIDVQSGRVIVRQIDKPEDSTKYESPDFGT
jgi:membrane-bound ClpP family serine protease